MLSVLDEFTPRGTCIRTFLKPPRQEARVASPIETINDPVTVHECTATQTTPVKKTSVEFSDDDEVQEDDPDDAVPSEVDVITQEESASTSPKEVDVITQAESASKSPMEVVVITQEESASTSPKKVDVITQEESARTIPEENGSVTPADTETEKPTPSPEINKPGVNPAESFSTTPEHASTIPEIETAEEPTSETPANHDIVVPKDVPDSEMVMQSFEGNTLVISDIIQPDLWGKAKVIEYVKTKSSLITTAHLDQLYLRELQSLCIDMGLARGGRKTAVVKRIFAHINTPTAS